VPHFFGLTQEYRKILFRQIHEIIFHGKGGYDYPTVYNMPVWLRNFTFKSIQEYYEKEAEEVNKAQSSAKKTSFSMPKPNYSTKARK